jgi:L-ectoine synthase
MIVKTEQDIEGGKGETILAGGDARVLRYLLREDGVGFTVSDIRVKAGTSAVLHYKNHIESNLVIEGEGTVEDMATGEVHDLAPGTIYVLDKHDKHRVNAVTAMRVICVFTPPLVGGEVHDEDGAYPLL